MAKPLVSGTPQPTKTESITGPQSLPLRHLLEADIARRIIRTAIRGFRFLTAEAQGRQRVRYQVPGAGGQVSGFRRQEFFWRTWHLATGKSKIENLPVPCRLFFLL